MLPFIVYLSDIEFLHFLYINNSNLRLYTRILFRDSIFKFFPTCEIQYKDSIGLIPDMIYFIEGLKFKINLGNVDDGYIGQGIYSDRNVKKNAKAGFHFIVNKI